MVLQAVDRSAAQQPSKVEQQLQVCGRSAVSRKYRAPQRYRALSGKRSPTTSPVLSRNSAGPRRSARHKQLAAIDRALDTGFAFSPISSRRLRIVRFGRPSSSDSRWTSSNNSGWASSVSEDEGIYQYENILNIAIEDLEVFVPAGKGARPERCQRLRQNRAHVRGSIQSTGIDAHPCWPRVPIRMR